MMGVSIRRLYSSSALRELSKRNLIHNTTLKTDEVIPSDAAVYAGFDPTASSLHVGNLLALLSLLHFNLAGNPTIALIGGATGRIGDPSWRATEKDRLADSIIERNIASLKEQISAWFPRATEYVSTLRPIPPYKAVKIVDNYDWYSGMNLLTFLDTVGSRMRVASLISRDSVKSRMTSEQGLSYAELSYQLLQAYDFYHLFRERGCRLQVGGSDQWGNIVSGLDLIHRLDPSATGKVHGLTLPLLVTSNGEKMGKSAGNAKWLDPSMTSPFEIYQYFTDFSDIDALSYLPKLSFRKLDTLQEIIQEHQNHPGSRLAQRCLAHDVTALIHTEAEAKMAERASDILFKHGTANTNATELDLLDTVLSSSKAHDSMVVAASKEDVVGARLVDMIAKHSGQSKNTVRSLVKSGAVSVNGTKIIDIHAILSIDHFLLSGIAPMALIKYGKQNFTLLKIKH